MHGPMYIKQGADTCFFQEVYCEVWASELLSLRVQRRRIEHGDKILGSINGCEFLAEWAKHNALKRNTATPSINERPCVCFVVLQDVV